MDKCCLCVDKNECPEDCKIYSAYCKGVEDFKKYLFSHKRFVKDIFRHHYEAVKLEYITETTAEELMGEK